MAESSTITPGIRLTGFIQGGKTRTITQKDGGTQQIASYDMYVTGDIGQVTVEVWGSPVQPSLFKKDVVFEANRAPREYAKKAQFAGGFVEILN